MLRPHLIMGIVCYDAHDIYDAIATMLRPHRIVCYDVHVYLNMCVVQCSPKGHNLECPIGKSGIM